MRQLRKTSGAVPAFRALRRLGLIAAACLYACSAGQPTLTSDRIESRFGSYGIEVLDSSPAERRASLYSVHDGKRICRTYAIVIWQQQPLADAGTDPSLLAAHARILAGASLGDTLRSAGWTLVKRSRYVGSLPAITPAPDWLELMSIDQSTGLAVHVYDVSIKKSLEVIEYARILEVHHPDFLDLGALRSLYVVQPGDALDSGSRAELLAMLASPP